MFLSGEICPRSESTNVEKVTFLKNGILEESWRAQYSRFILLSRLEAYGVVIPEGEGDEVGPTANRTVLREVLAASPARVHQNVVVLAAERATVRHDPHSTRYHVLQGGLCFPKIHI